MNEHEDRRIRALGAIDVELLGRGGAVGFAQRLPDAGAHRFAARAVPLDHLPGQRRVETLVIGGVELELIVIHEDARALLMGRWSYRTFGRRRRRDRHRRGAGEHSAACDLVANRRNLELHRSLPS
ncbi:MAG: hypothetical protein WBW74_03120 [Xanthobacteraceae bacterium]